MIIEVKFTAYNVQADSREAFVCNQLPGLHADAEDAATSKLWYGECWTRAKLDAADVRIES